MLFAITSVYLLEIEDVYVAVELVNSDELGVFITNDVDLVAADYAHGVVFIDEVTTN